MEKKGLNLVLEDSLDEFAKVIGEQTFLDLSKVKSLEQQVESLSSAIQSVLPNLKSNKDFDIVLSYSNKGLPSISVYVDSSQEHIPDLGVLDRRGLFELLERMNKNKKQKNQVLATTRLKPGTNNADDVGEHKKIDSGKNQLLLSQVGKFQLEDELKTVTDHPIFINSYSLEKRLIFASTSTRMAKKKYQFKFVTDSFTDIQHAGIACAQHTECLVTFSYKSKIPRQQMDYHEIKFPQYIVDLSAIMNKLRFFDESDQTNAVRSILSLLNKFE